MIFKRIIYHSNFRTTADFKWTDLQTEGVTDLSRALALVAEQLRIPPMSDRALPPVLVLISDGQPTDDFNKGLQALVNEPWGKKAVRIAIAIGEDADTKVLQKFIGHPELKPLLPRLRRYPAGGSHHARLHSLPATGRRRHSHRLRQRRSRTALGQG